jgi:flotillin
MVVLNGADGVSELLAKALTMGGTGLGLARQILAGLSTDQSASTNGSVPARTD